MSAFNLPIEIAEVGTGLAQAVMSELAQHVSILAQSGTPHVIDLTSLPMNEMDKQELKNALGQGEVSITLSTIGDSQIYETRFSGVWWVTHFTTDNRIISELIEIAQVPEIVKSHPDDIKKSADELSKMIQLEDTGERYE